MVSKPTGRPRGRPTIVDDVELAILEALFRQRKQEVRQSPPDIIDVAEMIAAISTAATREREKVSTYADKLEELQRLKAEVRRLEHQAEIEAKRMRPITELDERQMTSMQARADEAYQAAGRRAPAPLALESPDEFRRRLVIGLQGYSPRWQKADLGSLVDDALPIAESQVFADALQHGRTAGLQAREIRERVRTDHSGHRVVEFDGGPEAHFVRAFERPARRAILPTPEECTKKMQTAAMQRVEQIVRYGQRPTVSAPRAGF